jgi:hypothetical protein
VSVFPLLTRGECARVVALAEEHAANATKTGSLKRRAAARDKQQEAAVTAAGTGAAAGAGAEVEAEAETETETETAAARAAARAGGWQSDRHGKHTTVDVAVDKVAGMRRLIDPALRRVEALAAREATAFGGGGGGGGAGYSGGLVFDDVFVVKYDATAGRGGQRSLGLHVDGSEMSFQVRAGQQTPDTRHQTPDIRKPDNQTARPPDSQTTRPPDKTARQPDNISTHANTQHNTSGRVSHRRPPRSR